MQNKTEGELFLKRLRTSTVGFNLLLDFHAFKPPACHLWTTFSIFVLWSRPWAWPDCWVFLEFLHDPILEGVGRHHTT